MDLYRLETTVCWSTHIENVLIYYYPCFSLNSDDIWTDFNKGIILVSGNMTISKINLNVTRQRLA